MIFRTPFRKFFVLTVGFILVFAVLSFFTSFEIMKYLDRQKFISFVPPHIQMTKLIEKVCAKDLELCKNIVKDMSESGGPFKIDLVDASGKTVLASNPANGQPSEPTSQSDLTKPDITPLQTTPPLFLVLALEPFTVHGSAPGPGPSPGPGPHGPPIFWINIVSLLMAVLLGTAASSYFLVASSRERAKEAQQIMSELKRGNLKARFQISKIDEVSQSAVQFNTMAEEFEKLVERLRFVERTRTNLLQELAHDLRTPVASIRNNLETLTSQKEKISPNLRDELSQLSLKEIEYLGRLVEDLLFLARVSEHDYNSKEEIVDLRLLLEEEVEALLAQKPCADKIQMRALAPGADLATAAAPKVKGDRHQLRRCVRNALENAYAFAKKEVTIAMRTADKTVVLEISDDGPGLTTGELESFGIRRGTRIYKGGASDRVSVGLGSVIMKAVVESLHGHLEIKNNSPGDGATLSIQIPAAEA